MTNKATKAVSTVKASNKATAKPATASSNWIFDAIKTSNKLQSADMAIFDDATIAIKAVKLANLYLVPYKDCKYAGTDKQGVSQILRLLCDASQKPYNSTSKACLQIVASAGFYYGKTGHLVKQIMTTTNPMYVDSAGKTKTANCDWVKSAVKALKSNPDLIANLTKDWISLNKDLTLDKVVSSMVKICKDNKSYADLLGYTTRIIKPAKTA